MRYGLCIFVHSHEHISLHCVKCMFPPTCAALDGSDSGGSARGWAGPPVARCNASLFLVLRAAFLYGTHVAVAPHAEAAWHGQVQGIHCLWLHLTEHWLTHCLDLPIHLHLAHLQGREKCTNIQAKIHTGKCTGKNEKKNAQEHTNLVPDKEE